MLAGRRFASNCAACTSELPWSDTSVTKRDFPREVTGVIERVIADVPAPRTGPVERPDQAAARIAKDAAKRAALVSGSLALPPGPFGLLTVLPDLFVIWRTQRQMVADMFAVYGRTAELSRTHMLYCLFRHAASHVLRDVAVRSGQRFIVQQLSIAGDHHGREQDRRRGFDARRRNGEQPLDSARRRGGGVRVRVLGHAAGREDRPAAARDDRRPRRT